MKMKEEIKIVVIRRKRNESKYEIIMKKIMWKEVIWKEMKMA